jgi:hypothetical protein
MDANVATPPGAMTADKTAETSAMEVRGGMAKGAEWEGQLRWGIKSGGEERELWRGLAPPREAGSRSSAGCRLAARCCSSSLRGQEASPTLRHARFSVVGHTPKFAAASRKPRWKYLCQSPHQRSRSTSTTIGAVILRSLHMHMHCYGMVILFMSNPYGGGRRGPRGGTGGASRERESRSTYSLSKVKCKINREE